VPLNQTTGAFAPKATDGDRPTPPAAKTWRYQRELRPWQAEALAAWERNGHRGVVEAATGTGKTAVALSAAARLRSDRGVSLRVVIVVPTIALAAQWRQAVINELGVPSSLIGELHSGDALDFSAQSHILITVINTGRKAVPAQIVAWRRQGLDVLLIVDECHRAGSDHNARVVDTEATATLGLSATPERTDRGHDTLVYPGLGKPVYRYPVLTALDDGVLAPLRSVNLYVDFTSAEAAVWHQQRRDLGQALSVLEGHYPGITQDAQRMWRRIGELARDEVPEAMRVVALLARRAEVLANAENRQKCLVAVLDWLGMHEERVIVFHERIAQAERTAVLLDERVISRTLDHSGLTRADRSAGLGRFKRGAARALVAVRSLDEGIDVPDASIAVIASGSRSPRQRIQRLGRILRRSGDKQATCISILVRGTADETYVGSRDDGLVGPSRAVHHRWPGEPVDQAVVQRSTYQPARPKQDLIDQLTAIDLLGGPTEEQGGPEAQIGVVPPPIHLSGGYVASASTFSPNAWHGVDDVRAAAGMPPEVFDRLRPQVRRSFFRSLDPSKVRDDRLIHGSEIDAIRRMWKQRRRERGL
jgi:superfamily II DNA or RNA helicase